MRRHGRTETELLYCYRTPPYVKVGRPALDEETRALLEQQYPEIAFDWDTILREPPQVLSEQEALRRKEQRDARDARRKRRKPVDGAILVETAEGAETPRRAETAEAEVTEVSAAFPENEDTTTVAEDEGGAGSEGDEEDFAAEPDVLTGERTSAAESPGQQAAGRGNSSRRRRRRRRGKKRPGEPGSNTPPGTPPNSSV